MNDAPDDTRPDDAVSEEARPDDAGSEEARSDDAGSEEARLEDTARGETPPMEVRPDGPAAFRLGFVPGVNPAKWVRTWRARLTVPLELVPLPTDDAGAAVRAGDVEAALVRRPVATHDGHERVLHAIPLYDEVPVVVVSKEHLLSLADDVALDDLVAETVWHPLDDRFDWDALASGDEPTAVTGAPPGVPGYTRPGHAKEAVEIVASGVGVVVLPMSLARLHHRRDVVAVPLTDGPTSGVSLAWPAYDGDPLCEELVGIVRGRSVHSSRGAAAQDQAADQAAQGSSGRDGGRTTGATALTRTGEARRKKNAAARAQADRTAAQQRKRGDQSRARGKGKKRGR
ncbi:LysR substrate-binding domain-containing protein [Sanguibacter massiliensis]|uniref:LysR substrate-binding domain-containing protein n=1 Tax=Sanguibacter massiliensis TaxID=1973217 RepID=UPI001F5D4E48|nr:LysR substrate-binding domain-containing protein [Sanguibacter massiliensis]